MSLAESASTVRLQPGQSAPPFRLPDHRGGEVALADYAGRRLVLFVYPQANTPGCTKEVCDFRDSADALAATGLAVVGLSKDEPAENARFAEEQGLGYPLLSDPSLAVHHAYGAWGDKQRYGTHFLGTIRSTFVIGPEGLIEHALYNVMATGHVGRVRRLLGIG